MKHSIRSIINHLEEFAPLYLQEPYDNAGLISGDDLLPCTGVLCCLDVTETVINEAVTKGCNLIVAHHPILFRAVKKLTGSNYVERILIKAIKLDIAIYAIHTNLDNTIDGVNAAIAGKIGVSHSSLKVLLPKAGNLSKLYTYVPLDYATVVKEAIFKAGAGNIGKYSECSFSTAGEGTFRAAQDANPFTGTAGGERETVPETKMEFVFPLAFQRRILKALFEAHPYEEVAYEVISLENEDHTTGSGLIGSLPSALSEADFLQLLKNVFGLKAIRHTRFTGKLVKKVAVCGGAGSFLTATAIAKGADAFVTADVKYHEFFDANNQVLLADIGHFESEQFTIDLLANFLRDKIPTFAVLKTDNSTNPVHYFV